jgi:hypothetical protein
MTNSPLRSFSLILIEVLASRNDVRVKQIDTPHLTNPSPLGTAAHLCVRDEIPDPF